MSPHYFNTEEDLDALDRQHAFACGPEGLAAGRALVFPHEGHGLGVRRRLEDACQVGGEVGGDRGAEDDHR